MTMKTKVVRAGNSRAVILPSAVFQSQGWDTGDDLVIEELASGVIVRPPPKRSFAAAGKRFIKGHMTLLTELAKR